MISKHGIRTGRLVRLRHRSGAVSAETVVVAAASIAEGRSEVLDENMNVIQPEPRGVRRGRRVIEVLTIDPGPQYPFLILPGAPRHNAIAPKLAPSL